jgi:hypothetical protein
MTGDPPETPEGRMPIPRPGPRPKRKALVAGLSRTPIASSLGLPSRRRHQAGIAQGNLLEITSLKIWSLVYASAIPQFALNAGLLSGVNRPVYQRHPCLAVTARGESVAPKQ